MTAETNTRIRTNALGNRVERIATETHVFYDPRTQTASVVFQGEEFLTKADGTAIDEPGVNRQALSLDWTAAPTIAYNGGTDPVTGTKLAISRAGFALLVKAVYDAEHNRAYKA